MKANTEKLSTRESFSKIPAFVNVPDLLSIQTKAYQQFLQEWVPIEAREEIGLEGVFQNVFPIEDSHRNYILEYKRYSIDIASNTPHEISESVITYSVT